MHRVEDHGLRGSYQEAKFGEKLDWLKLPSTNTECSFASYGQYGGYVDRFATLTSVVFAELPAAACQELVSYRSW
jgi:hypothetical protein